MITVKINTTDITDKVLFPSLQVNQNLTSQVDTAFFQTRQVFEFDDDIEILDGATKIFAGKVVQCESTPDSGKSQVFTVQCVDHTFEFDRRFAARIYENQTVKQIIDDLVSSFAPSFTTNNVEGNYLVERIVFNQVPLSDCLRRLTSILGDYEWYIDEDKDVHFFPRFSQLAPFELTDTDGNHVYKSLVRLTDGTQLVNRVKVRGGEYDGAEYTDTITVVGDDTKSFKLPYRFADLGVELDTGSGFIAQDVGIDFINDFTDFDVLYNFQEQNIRFETALSNGNQIRFTGKPKIRVFAVAEDTDSIGSYGRIEKLIRENDIRSNLVARKRAIAELLAFNEPIVDAKFETYTSGLRTGMFIGVSSENRNFDDDLLIRQIIFKARTPEEFSYQIECVSTKRYGLIETLQGLLRPEALDFDEAEVAEDIFTANERFKMVDVTEMIMPVIADEDFEIAENYELDPLGVGVEPDFVLSEYVPTGQDDTKRPGRLDLSLKFY